MSAYKYVQFMRMRRASWRLAFRPELSVNDIALATGYEGPEAFARAFRQFAGQSPSDFRAKPDWPEWHSRFRPSSPEATNMNSLRPGRCAGRAFPATRWRRSTSSATRCDLATPFGLHRMAKGATNSRRA